MGEDQAREGQDQKEEAHGLLSRQISSVPFFYLQPAALLSPDPEVRLALNNPLGRCTCTPVRAHTPEVHVEVNGNPHSPSGAAAPKLCT